MNLKFALSALLICIGITTARGEVIDDYTEMTTKVTTEDTLITAGEFSVGELYADNWKITNTVNVINDSGVIAIANEISVDNGHTLYFDNRGTFSTGGYSAGVNVVQIVSHDNSMTDIGGAFDIRVEGTNTISLDSLLTFADGRTNVTLADGVSLQYDGNTSVSDLITTNYILEDTLKIILTASDITDGMVVLPNVSGVGTVTLIAPNIDSMYAVQRCEVAGVVSVCLVRGAETPELVPDQVSTFVDNLRNANSDDPLVIAMDGATSRDEINRLRSRSYRMNPINMTRAVRAFDAFNVFAFNSIDFNRIGVSYILGDDTDIAAAHMGFSFDINDSFSVDLIGHYGSMEYVGTLDEYSADLFSANINLNYAHNAWIGRVGAGATIARFDSGAVYDDGEIHNDPTGKSFYVYADAGYSFEWNGGFFVAPRVGTLMHYNNIASSSDNEFAAYAMSDIGWRLGNYNVKYDYAMRVRASTNDEYSVGINAGIWAPIDGIGGNISVTRMYQNSISFMKYMINLRYLF